MSSRDKFETYKNVFDDKTIETLFHLSSQGYFDELKSPISIGKEANIFSAEKKDKTIVCVKIYRVNTADFKRMYQYISGDVRFKGLNKKRRQIIRAWAQREYRNLLLAHEAKAATPTPYAVRENVLVMEFIGTKTGKAAPQMKQSEPKNLKKFAKQLILNIKKLSSKGIVHGDLSEYNILNNKDNPVIIDLSHGMKIEDPEKTELYKRDINTLDKYFTKRGVNIQEYLK